MTIKKNDEEEVREEMGLRGKAWVLWGIEEKEISNNRGKELKCGIGSHRCRKSLG